MGWATCDRGHVHRGRRGAAGLLVADAGSVLLQLRARWAHQGGTWSVPGGAREAGESAVGAALREAHEELGLDAEAVDGLRLHPAFRTAWTDSGGALRAFVEGEVDGLGQVPQNVW